MVLISGFRLWPDVTMIIQAGDLSIQIDTGTNQPGAIVQRLVNGVWQDYLKDDQPVTWPVALEQLAPGRYRLVESL